ncbi:hypothetical protein AGMMS50239_26110 [Bacteroidia bacterium]|nr:hypothetical protein AGMMS50239_26110 [Bacteroidia bacterium]
MYNEARLDEYMTKMSDFYSPFQKDIDTYYGSLKNSGIYDIANRMATDKRYLSSPEFGTDLAQAKARIPYEQIAKMKQSRDNANKELADYEMYRKMGVYDPDVHRLNGDYSTSESGAVYQNQALPPWIDPSQYLAAFAKDIDPEYVGTHNIAGGYILAEQSNSDLVDKAMNDALIAADPRTRDLWYKKFQAQNPGGTDADYQQYMQKLIGRIKPQYTKHDYQFLKDEADWHNPATGRKSSGGSGEESVNLSTMDWRTMKNLAADTLEGKERDRLSRLKFDGTTYGNRLDEIVKSIDELNAIIAKTENDDTKRLEWAKAKDDAAKAESNLINTTGAMLQNIDQRNLAQNVSLPEVASLIGAETIIGDKVVPMSGTQYEFKNADGTGSKTNTFVKSRLLGPDIEVVNFNGNTYELDNDTVAGLLFDGYNEVVNNNNAPAVQGGYGAFANPISQSRVDRRADRKYKLKDPKIAQEIEEFEDSTGETRFVNSYMNFIKDKLFQSGAEVSLTGKMSRSQKDGVNEQKLIGMQALIDKNQLKEVTRMYGRILTESGKPMLGKKLTDNPEEFIKLLWANQDGENKTLANKAAAGRFTIGKEMNLNSESSGERGTDGTIKKDDSRKGTKYMTLNFNYKIPAEKQTVADAANQSVYPTYGQVAQNMQQHRGMYGSMGTNWDQETLRQANALREFLMRENPTISEEQLNYYIQQAINFR